MADIRRIVDLYELYGSYKKVARELSISRRTPLPQKIPHQALVLPITFSRPCSACKMQSPMPGSIPPMILMPHETWLLLSVQNRYHQKRGFGAHNRPMAGTTSPPQMAMPGMPCVAWWLLPVLDR